MKSASILRNAGHRAQVSAPRATRTSTGSRAARVRAHAGKAAELVQLGDSDLMVSACCLGTMVRGLFSDVYGYV
eukprot:gene18991-25574_t